MTDPQPPAGLTASVNPDVNIDVSTPAFVIWDSNNYLHDVTFDLRRLAGSDDALFKLRATVVLKACAPNRTAIFVHIYSERITSLALEDVGTDESLAHLVEARKKLDTDLTGLRFALAQPPDVIGPKLHSLAPKNKASGDVMDSLRSLASQKEFTIYFPQKALPKTQLLSLCNLASTGALKTNPRQADLSSLYRGNGGQVIAVQDPRPVASASCEAGPSHGSPPSYNELDPSPPPAPLEIPRDVAAKKRRRLSSSSDDIVRTKLDPTDVEDMFRKMLDRQKAEMLQIMGEQQNRLYDRLLGDLKPYISQELEKMERRILDQVDQNLGKQVDEQDRRVEKQLDVWQDDVEATINSRINDVDERVEDEFYGLRLRLEDFIKEELSEAEQRVIDHLENAATISFS